jgi:hypothetical protein
VSHSATDSGTSTMEAVPVRPMAVGRSHTRTRGAVARLKSPECTRPVDGAQAGSGGAHGATIGVQRQAQRLARVAGLQRRGGESAGGGTKKRPSLSNPGVD